jgi:hypothetical protein
VYFFFAMTTSYRTCVRFGVSTRAGHVHYLTDGDVDSDGNWAPDVNLGAAWPVSAAPFTAGIGPFQGYAQVILQSSSTGKYFTDASLDVSMSWSAKIKYTWSGYSGCLTPAFTLSLDTGSTYSFQGNNYTGTPYNTTDGSYILVGTFTMPTVTGCNGEANNINGAMGAGNTALMVLWQKAYDPVHSNVVIQPVSPWQP